MPHNFHMSVLIRVQKDDDVVQEEKRIASGKIDSESHVVIKELTKVFVKRTWFCRKDKKKTFRAVSNLSLSMFALSTMFPFLNVLPARRVNCFASWDTMVQARQPLLECSQACSLQLVVMLRSLVIPFEMVH